MTRRRAWVACVLAVIAIGLGVVVWKAAVARAFTDGVQAYLYGYPLVLIDTTRAVMAAGRRDGHAVGANQFSHLKAFPDPTFTDMVAPNADTLYSFAFLDVGREPIVLHVPDTHGRWYLMELVDGWTNAFASIGKRQYGTREADFAIVGPHWTGELPANLIKVASPTNIVWVLGRTFTRGAADYDAVHAVQAQYVLTPLSQLGNATAPQQEASTGLAVDGATAPAIQVARMDAAAFFGRLAVLMADNPPSAEDGSMLKRLARLGVVPGRPFDPATIDPETIKGLELAAWTAKALFDARAPGSQGAIAENAVQRLFFSKLIELVQRTMNKQNGWTMPLNLGSYGTSYARRAVVALIGLGANRPEDAVYATARADDEGMPLHGANRYQLHFARREIPPVDDFWSVTVYNSKMFFVSNPINRYAIGDRDALRLNADGSLDLWVQNESPGADRESNWLPAPHDGFNLMMRLYGPRPDVLNGRWKPPLVKRVTN
jgi:hypothetical protein